MDIPPDQFVPIAQLIGIGILGIFAAAGMWWGQRRKLRAESTIEVAGALVDSSAVKALVEVIERNNQEHVHNRAAHEKGRTVLHRLVDSMDELAREMRELRQEIRQQGDAMRKR